MDKNVKKTFVQLFHNRLYVISIILCVVLAYGYELTHCSLAADDICVDYYFRGGLGVSIGRWPFFILANWFRLGGISRFIPFVDIIGVLILILGAAIWSIYLQQVTGYYGINIGYEELAVFSCFFVSYSLIAQVWIYYLHNGIALGYVFVGMTLLILFSYFEDCTESKKKRVYLLVESVGLICLAISFYESMMIVFLFGVSLYLLIRYYRKDKVDICHIFTVLTKTAVIAGGAILLRYVIIHLVASIYDLPVAARQPKVEMLSIDRVRELIAKTICHYFLLPEYQPICLLMLCTACGFLFLLYDAIRNNRIRLLVIATISYLSFFTITYFSNQVLPYRTMQVLPAFVAFCMMLFIHKCGDFMKINGIKRGGAIAAWIISGILMWNNLCEINYSFYMEYENYQFNRAKITNIGLDLKKLGYDVNTEKVFFVGAADDLPYPRKEDSVSRGSMWDKARFAVCESANCENDINEASYYQTLSGNALEWAIDAFGNQQQLVNLFEREGIYLNIADGDTITDDELNAIPSYPQDGYIVKRDNLYLINMN